jgi:hypothetical protein
MRFIDKLFLWIAVHGLALPSAFGRSIRTSRSSRCRDQERDRHDRDPGNIKNRSIYIKDSKIAAVGESVNAPGDATTIDAGGKCVTPDRGLALAHRARRRCVNEATSPITPQMMMKMPSDYQDKAIYRALAGGA